MSKTNPVFVISDLHAPFEHERYLDFCKHTYKKFDCKTVVHIGDLVDNHSISYHEHDPNGWSPANEMRATDQHLKAWFKAFPKVFLCRGNHDALVDRKAKTVGLPRRCFKTYREMWGLPKAWKDDFHFEIDGVIYTHGLGYSGKTAHLNAAIANGKSTVIGHLHSIAGVEHHVSESLCIFGMSVGCGIDRHKYAFAYGKDFKRKPILGCGIVFNDRNAQFIPMELGVK